MLRTNQSSTKEKAKKRIIVSRSRRCSRTIRLPILQQEYIKTSLSTMLSVWKFTET